MARKLPSASLLRRLSCGIAGAWLLPAAWAAPGSVLVAQFLGEADRGHCIESIAYRLIHEQGASRAGSVVNAALAALAQREQQQRSMGCVGDIAAQAIAAGADPDEVLKATAAGL